MTRKFLIVVKYDGGCVYQPIDFWIGFAMFLALNAFHEVNDELDTLRNIQLTLYLKL